MKRSFIFLAMLMSVIFSVANASTSADKILGKWITAEGKSKVDISKCGNQYCGKIIWLKEPEYPADDELGMAGKTKIDRHNPQENLRSEPILNLEILSGFRFVGDNEWEDGKIYDPNNGKTYSSILTLKNANTLNVRGYIGFSFIGRTTVWTR